MPWRSGTLSYEGSGCRPGSRRHPKMTEEQTTVPYPEYFVAPMREELTQLGVEELRTAEAVDAAVARKGTTLVVVNSVCGCAAGKARPGIAMALGHDIKPDHLTTVFAGADVEATDRARELLHRLSAQFALGGAAAGRPAGVHDGAPADRRPVGRPDRPPADGGLRPVLRAGHRPRLND